MSSRPSPTTTRRRSLSREGGTAVALVILFAGVMLAAFSIRPLPGAAEENARVAKPPHGASPPTGPSESRAEQSDRRSRPDGAPRARTGHWRGDRVGGGQERG